MIPIHRLCQDEPGVLHALTTYCLTRADALGYHDAALCYKSKLRLACPCQSPCVMQSARKSNKIRSLSAIQRSYPVHEQLSEGEKDHSCGREPASQISDTHPSLSSVHPRICTRASCIEDSAFILAFVTSAIRAVNLYSQPDTVQVSICVHMLHGDIRPSWQSCALSVAIVNISFWKCFRIGQSHEWVQSWTRRQVTKVI